MKVIETGLLTPSAVAEMSAFERDCTYNGLDCCVTLEVLDAMLPLLDNISGQQYSFERSLQGPILEMNMRGLLVDIERRDQVVKEYREEVELLEANLDRIVKEGIGVDLNWRSPQQLMRLLYNVIGLPPVRKRNAHGQLAPTVNRDALEKLGQYFIAQPIVNHILALRDIAKKISVLTTEIDPDCRIRSNFNIAGTTTTRLSSSLGDFGTGGNLQNVEKKLRSVFIADPGMKFANIDLRQADARNVGALCWDIFGAHAYLDATESGDLHTTVCRLAWTDLPWPENISQHRAIADQPAYRHHTYRDLAKKLGHGTNYYGQPATMARHTKVDKPLIEDFQSRYFAAFPEIRHWHAWTKLELQSKKYLITPFGFRRYFWGRPNDDSTLREAIASSPQSMTARQINNAMLNVWRLNICSIMLQVHDSLVIQYPEEREADVLAQVVPAFKTMLVLRDNREFFVPCDVQVGWNLGELKPDNPDGLTEWKGADDRKRTYRATKFADWTF